MTENLIQNETPPRADCFATTRWTQVLASQGDSDHAREALSQLCAAYYLPVVGFLRREGRDEDAARELAHEFFARVLEGKSFGSADPRRGRFRSYLLGALKHFLANRRAHELREKRGGGIVHEPLPSPADTSPGEPEPADEGLPAEAMFDREWALSLLDRAMSRLKLECEERGAGHEFELLKPWLTGENAGITQAELARKLAMNEGAARVCLHRFRRRFGDFVKSEIGQTVHRPEEISAELRHLLAALS